jgi:protein TonB
MKKIFTFILIVFGAVTQAQQQDSITKVVDADLDSSVIFAKVEVEAQFPGGEKAWIQYIIKVVEKNVDRINDDKKSNGTCIIQFIVDKEGNISNVEALTLTKSVLAEVAVDAIKKGPKWIPAMQFGKPVKAYRRQPVTFRRAK